MIAILVGCATIVTVATLVYVVEKLREQLTLADLVEGCSLLIYIALVVGLAWAVGTMVMALLGP